jgi:hypothetical protein
VGKLGSVLPVSRHVATEAPWVPGAGAPGLGRLVTAAAGRYPVQISAAVPLRISIEPSMVATGFVRTTVAPVLPRAESALPIRITTCWRWTLGDSGRLT